ncbi:MAG: hypothetical protein A2Y09_05590 [Planctomycetes bacterium GWA2_39_15]|nr:MAG: hypothetical protein A2Y09_05590 [Planctomycetes bacterium GWA2_39_15]
MAGSLFLAQGCVSDKLCHMARPLRIKFDGALYHVTSGGNAREPIFITDTNRVLFLDKKESTSIARIKT